MGVPTLITVTGTARLAGSTVGGRLVFASSTLVRDINTNDVMLPQEIEVVVGANGEFTVQLPATDDPGFSPTGWTWEVRPHFPFWNTAFAISVPYNAPGGTIDFSDLAPVPADGNGALYSLASHTHESYQTALTTLLAANAAGSSRIATAGEFVIDRRDVNTESAAATGTLYVTHFTAAVTETILNLRTKTGGTAAVGGTHAWVGVLSWDGTNYNPLVCSADVPTRWNTTFAMNDAPLYAWNHVGDPAYAGFNKVAGTRYAMFILWIGAGSAPTIPAGGGWYSDALEEPRVNGFLSGQTAPPSSALSGAFMGPDPRRYQALLRH